MIRVLALFVICLGALFGACWALVEIFPAEFDEDAQLVFEDAARIFGRNPEDFVRHSVLDRGLLNGPVFTWRKNGLKDYEIIYVDDYRRVAGTSVRVRDASWPVA